MKTCASCGKANNPVRKYCLRCGKPLYPEKETKQEAIQKTLSSSQVMQRVVEKPKESVSPSRSSTTPTSVTTGDRWVKPSEVSKDRVRTTSPTTGKSEMEKAREAFAKAEQVGIAEESGEIVETRMLRASEVHELMESLDKQREEAVSPQPQVERVPTHTMQRVVTPSAPEARMNPPQTPHIVQTNSMPIGTRTAEVPKPVPRVETGIPTQSAQERVAAPPPKMHTMASAIRPPKLSENIAASHIKKPMPELDAIVSEITDPDFLQDQIIKDTVNDLTNLHTEIKHYEADLRFTSERLEKETKDCWNKAEVKRIQFESLEEQLRLAKQEWTDASKVYQNADKRKKDEISSREKHIKDLEKRISKTEDSIRKRVRDLEKEKIDLQ